MKTIQYLMVNIPMLLLGILGFSILMGTVLYLTFKMQYILCLFPVVAAVLTARLLQFLLHYTKTRQAVLAVLAGVMTANCTYAAYHMAAYVDFLRMSRNDILEAEPDADWYGITQTLLRDEVGRDGFIGFVKHEAKRGIMVSSTSIVASTAPMRMWGIFIEGYWLLEWLGFLIFCVLGAYIKTKHPFCEDTNEWLDFKQVGIVPSKHVNQFMQLLHQGDYKSASLLVKQVITSEADARLLMAQCQPISPTGRIRLNLPQGHYETTLLDLEINAQQFNELQGA